MGGLFIMLICQNVRLMQMRYSVPYFVSKISINNKQLNNLLSRWKTWKIKRAINELTCPFENGRKILKAEGNWITEKSVMAGFYFKLEDRSLRWKVSNNDLKVVRIIIYIFKNKTYFHSTAESRSLTEKYLETLSCTQVRDSI